MTEFVYLFRGGDMGGTPEQMQQHMQKWEIWMKELGENGHITGRSGRPLEPTGKTVTGSQKIVTDGPYAEAKDLVGGYMLIEASDLAQATKVSEGCPILEVGGIVEVRAVMQMGA